MYRVLVRHQDRLHEILNEGRALLGSGGKDDVARLGRLRWELVRALRAYQLFKHLEIFGRAVSCGSPEDAALARAMRGRCDAIGEAFTAFTSRWSGTDIVREWTRYQPAALELNARMAAHLAREREEAARLCASAAAPIRRALAT